MKKAIVGVVLALIVACSLGGCGSAEAQTTGKGDRWEYTAFAYDMQNRGKESFISKANELGKDGWELVCEGGYNYIFKRKLP
jgi:hypothetical protein